MGCGISKCKHSGEGTALGCHHFRIVHRKNDRAAVDGMMLVLSEPPLPEDHEEEEEHAKDENMKSSEGKEGHENEDNDDYEHEQDDSYHSLECPRSPSFRVFYTSASSSLECPRSPSFRVFYTSASSHNDSSKGSDNAEEIKDKPQYDVENNKKGSSDGTRKKSKAAGKGIKSVQQKLHLHIFEE